MVEAAARATVHRVTTVKEQAATDVPGVLVSVAPTIAAARDKAATNLAKVVISHAREVTSHVPAIIAKAKATSKEKVATSLVPDTTVKVKAISRAKAATSKEKAATSLVLVTIAKAVTPPEEEPEEAIVLIPQAIILMPSTA